MINEFLDNSNIFGLLLSIGAYAAGVIINKRFNYLNPLLFAITAIIAALLIFGVDYEVYNHSTIYLRGMLTPVTVCLAIPLYKQLRVLRKFIAELGAGIVAGTAAGMFSIFIMSWLFKLTHEEYVTLLPKSVTTAIGMGISEELGGNVSITIAIIIITGILGNIFGGCILKLFRIKEPIAKGLALGTAAHAIGTVRALEMGEKEGAAASLSIAAAGITAAIIAPFFVLLY